METLIYKKYYGLFSFSFHMSCSQSGDLSQLLNCSWDGKQCRFYDLVL